MKGLLAAVLASRRPANILFEGGNAVKQRGQASVELLGALPAVVVLGLVLFQLLAVGYAKVLAGSAAEAGALSLAAGRDPRAAVRAALPSWSRSRAAMSVRAGRVRVRLSPPSPLRLVGRRLQVRADAAVAQ